DDMFDRLAALPRGAAVEAVIGGDLLGVGGEGGAGYGERDGGERSYDHRPGVLVGTGGRGRGGVGVAGAVVGTGAEPLGIGDEQLGTGDGDVAGVPAGRDRPQDVAAGGIDHV